ncbi:hypothetical protein EYF80_023546 [Liparis tanakae]|uniref:Uncharacterized protein n=1 Tax=Liparis tanakae TaxID=230148 RepID=A0A4Z2HKA6_9TELE|nr:hypothetical protein EYF80_023546 [Liparis tanakae]
MECHPAHKKPSSQCDMGLGKMAEVRKSLEQIQIFSEHNDVLTQEIQDENDQLKDQLGRIEGRHLAGQASSVERERSRLERDLEEGSRRLAVAHNQILRLTDELESAHLTQRAYDLRRKLFNRSNFEFILMSVLLRARAAAQQEVDELGQEVHKLKKYEIVELRKAKELNDRLDLEMHGGCLESLEEPCPSAPWMLRKALCSRWCGRCRRRWSSWSRLCSSSCSSTQQVHANGATEQAEAVSLQREVERLEAERLEAERLEAALQGQTNLVNELAAEKELTISITVENEKLLVERRRLPQQLNEEAHNKEGRNLTASSSRCRYLTVRLQRVHTLCSED